MEGHPRRPPMLRQRSDSQGRALSPADSVTSIGSSRGPLLSWMFHHLRRENQDSLNKEDLRKLLGVDVNNEQLDEAFENLDVDGDGRVSFEEFMGGFARFLLEAPTTPGRERNSLLMSVGLEQGLQRRPSGKKRGSVRRSRLMDEELYESAMETGGVLNGAGGTGENGGPAVKPSESFGKSLGTLSSHNRHSIATLWRGLSDTNPELLMDFEEFVGEVAEEVEHAQRALENQRKATKQEALELDEEMECRLNAANANLQIQTALTEVKTKVKLEQRLGDKEKELGAVKQKLQELEGEVQAGQQAHTQLEEQYEALSLEKADLQVRLEDREAVLMKKHEEMESLNRQASVNVTVHTSHIEETEVELQEMQQEYEREISELREKIMGYEISQNVTSDDDMSLVSGQTQDLLSTRHRHTSRHSLLDEILKQEGLESPILRGEPLMPDPSEQARPPWRANSLPNLFQTRHRLEPITASPMHYHPSPAHTTRPHREIQAPEISGDQSTATGEPPVEPSDDTGRDHVTQPAGHVTGDGPTAMALLDTPFSRARSATVSGGGRPKYRNRKPRKSPAAQADQSHMTSHDSHVTSCDSHVTASSEGVPVTESEVTLVVGERLERKEEEEEEEKETSVGGGRTDEQYIMKCQPLQFIENLATQPDYVFKILVVGNSYVGKSSFLMRLCTNAFSARYSSTIGVDFYSKALKVDERIISLQLWDTAGQERFQSVTKAYYRGAQGVILMYDITQEESFIAVKSWINSIQENVDQMPTGLMLIGNKHDLDEMNEREVSTETGETFAKIYNAHFMETSAKTGFNVGNCLMNLVRTIKVYYEQDSSERRERGIQVNNKPKGSGCCGR